MYTRHIKKLSPFSPSQFTIIHRNKLSGNTDNASDHTQQFIQDEKQNSSNLFYKETTETV